MSISVNELRQGVVFLQDGKYYEVESFGRHKMARGKGVVKVGAYDLETGNLRELTFKSGESVKEVEAQKYNLEFVYYDERKNQIILHQPETGQRLKPEAGIINPDKIKYLSEGAKVVVTEVQGKIVDIQIPPTVELKVTMAPPGDKGDTAGSATKEVTLETGLKIKTPLFIKKGDLIKVNTESGEYRGRV